MVIAFPARARQRRRGSIPLTLTLASALLIASACGGDDPVVPAAPTTAKGAVVAVGNGTARTFIVESAGHVPQSIGVELTTSALGGLPDTVSEWTLPLPADSILPPWDHVMIDWNPQGHPPPGIYDLPHFDFHFYEITPGEQMAIAGGPDTTTVPAKYVPQDYASQVMSVPMMGVHWADTLSGEFHGHTFDETFIYGFSQGHMVFAEPMVTLATLQGHPNVTAPVKQPHAFEQPGLYPRSYGVRYDASSGTVRVSLDSLTATAGG